MYPPVYGQPRYSTDHGHPSLAAPPLPSGSQNPTTPIPPRYSTDGHPSPFPLPSVPYTPNPTMPYGQLSSSMPFPGVAGQWSSRLFHCFDDPAICFITCLCPCITFGQIAEVVSKGSRSCYESGTLYGLLLMTGFACLYSCSYRSKLRGQYDLAEDPCADCLVHFCCETCALCQEYRELKNQGFDMGIGWEANMDRQKRGITVPPIVAQGMRR